MKRTFFVLLFVLAMLIILLGLLFYREEEFTYSIEGCAAGQATRNYIPTVEKDLGLKISVSGNNAELTHVFEHNCCMELEVSESSVRNEIIIEEIFSGEKCRCTCQSTVRAAIGGLQPGNYDLKIYYVEGFERALLEEASFVVK